MLENEGFDRTFGPASPAPYLATELAPQGALLNHYYGIGHFGRDNYITMISGQAPNPATQSDCHSYVDFVTSGITADGQAVGQGCIYPPDIKTIADQLQSAGLSWKAYMELGNDPHRENSTCGQPKLGTHGEDLTQKATPDDQYAARHNPFVYFHSIVDKPVCASAVVNLAALKDDLRLAATTPNYVFITPNLCHDGHDGGCAGDKEPGGLASADAFSCELRLVRIGAYAGRLFGVQARAGQRRRGEGHCAFIELCHRLRQETSHFHKIRLCRPYDHSSSHVTEPRHKRDGCLSWVVLPLFILCDERRLVFGLVSGGCDI
jgi:Phosphoesterase family